MRVAASSAGEQRLADAETARLDRSLRAAAARFADGDLDAAACRDLGRRLAGVLFPGRVATLFDDALGDLPEGDGLRLRLRLDDRSLADLPWELAYLPLPGTPEGEADDRGFLALRNQVSIVRYEVLERETRPLAPVEGPLRLVGLLADPARRQPGSGARPLALDAERRAVERAVAEAGGIEVAWCAGGTLDDLTAGLDRGAHLFHFAGHGGFGDADGDGVAEGVLVLEGGDGEAAERPLAAADLARHLGGRGVRLAVLNACEGARRDTARAWSGAAPALVQAGVPAVVAMQRSIRDLAAVAFGRRLYERLAAGCTVDEAVTAGRQAVIDAAGTGVTGTGAAGVAGQWAAPVLYLRRDDGVLFPRAGVGEAAAPPPGRRTVVNAALLAAVVAVAGAWGALGGSRYGLLAVGGGVLGALAVGLGLLRWLLEDSLRRGVRRVLSARRATLVLAPLLAVAVALAGWDLWSARSLPLRVVPTLTLIGRLPAVETEDPATDCRLVLTADGRELAVVDPFRRAVHYLGVDADGARALEAAEGDAALAGGFSLPAQAGLRDHLLAQARHLPELRLDPVAALDAAVACGEGNEYAEVAAKHYEVGEVEDGKISTLYIP